MIENKKRGITLVEVLIVMAVIGTLATIIFANVSKARQNARDAQRKTDIALIQGALERYYFKHGEYPSSVGTASNPNNVWKNSTSTHDWGLLAEALDVQLPVDPLNIGLFAGSGSPDRYNYSYVSLGEGCSLQWYALVYRLEKNKGVTGPSDESTGVMLCDDGLLNYNGGSTTVGVSPKQPL